MLRVIFSLLLFIGVSNSAERAEDLAEADATFSVYTLDQLPKNLKSEKTCWGYQYYPSILKLVRDDKASQKAFHITNDRQIFHSICLEAQNGIKQIFPSQEEITEILKIHNEARAKEPATEMMKMTWDDQLMDTAAGWVSQCVLAHDMTLNRASPCECPCNHTRCTDRFTVGQNMAHLPREPDMSTMMQFWVAKLTSIFGKKKKQTKNALLEKYKIDKMDGTVPKWPWVIQTWLDQKKSWKHGLGTVTGASVGEFTQIVSDHSYKVGCAYSDCGVKGHLWACNYGPAGNVGGFKTPYKKGEKGSACTDKKNSDGLCDCEDKSKAPDGQTYPFIEDCDSLKVKDANTCKCVPKYDKSPEVTGNLTMAKECEPVVKGGCVGFEDDFADCPDGSLMCCCTDKGDIVEVDDKTTCKWPSKEGGACPAWSYCVSQGDESNILTKTDDCRKRRSVVGTNDMETRRRR